jgi:hypothetical protein
MQNTTSFIIMDEAQQSISLRKRQRIDKRMNKSKSFVIASEVQ